MSVLVPLPFVLPLFAAGLTLAFQGRPRIQRLVSVLSLGGTLGIAIALLLAVDDGGSVAVQIGGWIAPIGITLVVDLFSAIMLVVSAAMILAVLIYAISSPKTDDRTEYFHPVYLMLAAGVFLAFLAGDLFNLFVAFEVMLTASYVLITLGAGRDQVRSGMTYVVISLVASALFLTSVALIYASTGTVNMAQLAGRIGDIPDGLQTALGMMLLIAFGIKAAVFPLFFWLPDSYPTAPTPVTAIFAGLLTKVGVYAIMRTQTLLFPSDGASNLLLAIAVATMVVGVLGAISQNDIKRILSFHIVSQIGYMILGLAFFTLAGLAGAIFYIVHHIIVKTTLFLVSGLIEQRFGTAALNRLGGIVHRSRMLPILFLLPALSLAGLPPFSGFVAKLALVDAGLAIGQGWAVGASLLVSLLTLFSMTKIWGGVFWGQAEDPAADPEELPQMPPGMVGPTALLVALSLVVVVAAAPLWDLSQRAAGELLSPGGYIEAVLP
ncbi:MAG: Na+/H+ antiporter subunit D [Actinomycetota bacterium]